jgi:hypothetical protein
MAQLALENVQLQDAMRQCEARAVWMAHERATLDAAVFESRFACQQAVEARARQDAELHALQAASHELGATVGRLEQEAEAQARQAGQRAAQLEARLAQAETRRRELERDLEETNRRWSLDKRQLSAQEQKYASDAQAAIARARADEDALRTEMHELAQDRRKAHATISELERQLGQLRIENATLTAKLDVYSRFSQQQLVQRESPRKSDANLKLALAKIEERIGQDRRQMFSLLHEMKGAGAPPRRGDDALAKLVKGLPAKRAAAPKDRRAPVDGDASGAVSGTEDDEPAPAPALKTAPPPAVAVAAAATAAPAKKATIKLKPKPKKAAPPPAPATPEQGAPEQKENRRLPAPQLFVKKSDALAAIPKQPVQAASIPAAAAPASPMKARATFVPAAARPTTIPAAAAAAKPRFLANMSFGAGDAAAHDAAPGRKRIKLPERGLGNATIAPTADGNSVQVRRNIDPAVYSAIVSGFNIKKD